MNKALIALCLFFPVACSSQVSAPSSETNSYETCVAAGNPILKMWPPKCVDQKTGKYFVKSMEQKPEATPAHLAACQNKCGDGTCDQIVCQGTDCPCAETPENCPADCALQF
jgi:hypothetical protein